jgi:hypothetical protein
MFRTSLLLLGVAATAVAAGTNFASREIMSGSYTLKSGVTIRFCSLLTPAGKFADSLGGGGIGTGEDAIHRTMIDRKRGVYFGYDLVIGSGDAASGWVATFRPLSAKGDPSLKALATPKFPAPQTVRDGDIIELDLMVSPDGTQRLTDYIQILAHAPEPPAATTTAEPRNFTLDDGPVTLDPLGMTIWTNGQKLQGSPGVTVKPGATFWIAFPGQGRYVLSLIPHEGFTQSGTVRDNAIAFRDGGQQFEVRFMSPIAGAGKAWNAYVLHDRAYQPRPNQQGMVNSGTDRLESLLPGR